MVQIKKIETSRCDNNHNSLILLVPPAGIEPAAHGLGNLPPSNLGIPKDNEGLNYFKHLSPSFIFRRPPEKQGNRGVFSPIC